MTEKQVRRVEVGQAGIINIQVQCASMKCGQHFPIASFASVPCRLDCRGEHGWYDAKQGFPLLPPSHHDRSAWCFLDSRVKLRNQRFCYQRSVARQNQHEWMARYCKACSDSCQGSGEIKFDICDQLICKFRITPLVSIAGNQQVIGQRTGDLVQPCNERLAMPFNQPLVLAAHSLALPTCQQQNRAIIKHALLHQVLRQKPVI